jgi:hypothetical protein
MLVLMSIVASGSDSTRLAQECRRIALMLQAFATELGNDSEDQLDLPAIGVANLPIEQELSGIAAARSPAQ